MITSANTMVPNTVYLTLGTNLGNRKKNLQTALLAIKSLGKITKRSSIYDTEPVGYKDQGNFLNLVIELQTKLSPHELIIRLQKIEHQMGRNRDQEIKNGPRIIDLDILLYNNQIINQPHLRIPHPRLHQRLFVLNPLAEIAPKLIHPKLKKSVQELKSAL